MPHDFELLENMSQGPESWAGDRGDQEGDGFLSVNCGLRGAFGWVHENVGFRRINGGRTWLVSSDSDRLLRRPEV